MLKEYDNYLNIISCLLEDIYIFSSGRISVKAGHALDINEKLWK